MGFDWGRGLGNSFSGGISGASAGAAGGPLGMAIGSVAGGIGGLASGFFGNDDPRQAANMMDNIPGRVKPFYQPYMDAGKSALPVLQGQYGNLLNDPGGMVNKIGAGYHESPGFQFALKKALAGGNRAFAAGGMGGSPSAANWGMETATGLANQDYNTYLQNALSQYGMGLKGEEGLAGMGQKAGSDYADMMAQALAQEAKIKYGGSNYGAQ